MKFVFSFLIIVVTFSSCQKQLENVEDYFPKVSMTAKILSDGTVEVTGNLIDPGAGEMDNVGFSFSDKADWVVSENQVLINATGSFTHIYDQPFDPTKTYYFRAFAINSFGYSLSEVVTLSGIASASIVAPCTLNPNVLIFNSISSNVSNFPNANVGFDDVEYRVTSSNVSAAFVFNSPPLTGIYTVKPFLTQGAKDVVVNLSTGFNNSSLSVNSLVYVNRIDATSFKVEICNSTANINGNSFDFRCNFTRPY